MAGPTEAKLRRYQVRALETAKGIVIERIQQDFSRERAEIVSLSDLADRLQLDLVDSKPDLWTSQKFINVVFSEEFLTAYNSAHRDPKSVGQIVPRLSFPELASLPGINSGVHIPPQ